MKSSETHYLRLWSPKTKEQTRCSDTERGNPSFSHRIGSRFEAGRPITVTTLLRICEVFELPMSKLVQGLTSEGVYEALGVEIPSRRRGRS